MQNAKDITSSKPSTPFGVEIEINPLPASKDDGALPGGSYEVASLIHNAIKERVQVSGWCNNHNNNYWVVKPDSSCGIEICSPVLKGWYGISKVHRLVENLRNRGIKVDSNCSFHVHFDVSRFTEDQLFSIICWWIKLEAFFLDTVPLSRKLNPYCKLIAQSNLIKDISNPYTLPYFVEGLGSSKYHTLNTFHMYHKRRQTIEFRIMDGFCCISPNSASCWVALLNHFVEVAVSSGVPQKFEPNNPYSGFCWLDPEEAFTFLGFSSRLLCHKLKLVRSWLLGRLLFYGKDYSDFGIFSKSARQHAYNQIIYLNKLHGTQRI